MMKHLLIFSISIFTFLGCDSDDNDSKLTIYEGVLLYEDDLSPVVGATLNFQGRKRVSGVGQLDEVIIEEEIESGNDGSFRFELETTQSSIDYFAVNLFMGENPTSIDCAPNSCVSLPTRTILNDLRFLAERE
ncbi:hypothetical protein [Flagellimonas lutaonensis]|uniref:Lipoprotein n=1 Tax=Flagellimonas lutaonensis TaxID=516051 RepID=A0A0D5YPN7_9FLAO|nr:hypothetical protein [Allomuricauda lutaonensis]AKA33904.1 hypothetical protein VC82_217 [Allomuricauda lutaonensis]